MTKAVAPVYLLVETRKKPETSSMAAGMRIEYAEVYCHVTGAGEFHFFFP